VRTNSRWKKGAVNEDVGDTDYGSIKYEKSVKSEDRRRRGV
jgi:hypothetical protein